MTTGLISGGINWAAIDGRAAAPAGVSPQYPTMFTGLANTYAARPIWQVAGVDYGVGFPAVQAFKDPTVDTLPVGTFLDTTNKLVKCQSTNNLTFDGWDFSLHGGYELYVNGTTSNTTVTNCKFLIGANAKPCIVSDATAGNLTITYCVIDGAALVPSFNLISSGAEASLVVKYCWLKNAASDSIHFQTTSNITGGNNIIEFNLFENANWTIGAHSDHVQGFGACQSTQFLFNTVYQSAANVDGNPGRLNSAIRYGDFGGTQTVNNLQIGYNSIIGVGLTGHNDSNYNAIEYAFETTAALPAQIVNMAIYRNYIDMTTPVGFQYPTPGNGVSGAQFSNNINMLTGAVLNPPF